MADNFVRRGLRARLKRIERVNDRFATPAFKTTVVRHRLEELLTLPQLTRDEIQRIATLTARAFAAEFERICDEVLERTGKDNDSPVIWLLAYQKVARTALILGMVPPYWPELEIRHNRRTPPDPERVPGAVLRITCATGGTTSYATSPISGGRSYCAPPAECHVNNPPISAMSHYWSSARSASAPVTFSKAGILKTKTASA